MTAWLRVLVLSLVLALPAVARGDAAVLVERVRFAGSPGIGQELLASAVDVPVGRELPREELDQRLERARQRLLALGYFSSVDLQLVKGSERGRFELIVTLEAERSTYAGLSLQHQKSSEDGRYSTTEEAVGSQQVFVGSRNLLGRGLRGEVGLWRREGRSESHDKPGDNTFSSDSTSQSRYTAVQVSLFEPSIMDSPWFAGTMLSYFANGSRERSASGGGRGEGYHRSMTVAAGRRFGLMSAAMSLFRASSNFTYRYKSAFYDDSSAYRWFGTRASLSLRYSDKSFLTTIEPGTVLSLSLDRTTAPEWDPATALAGALHTFVFNGDKALTPAALMSWQYLTSCRSSGGEDEVCKDILQRYVDLALTYEHVLVNRLVLGITYGEYLMLRSDRSDYDVGYPKRRWRVAATYNAHGLILELALLYGNGGLDRSQWEYFFPDHSRFTR